MANRNRALLLLLLLVLLTMACDLGTGGDNATPTPVPPAGRSGMDALNATQAEGLKADCSLYPIWLACDPQVAPIPQKELP